MLTLEGSEGAKAILVDNDGGGTYNLNVTEGKGIIIVTGDAHIQALNFSGLVLIGGKVTVADGGSVFVSGDSESLAYALMISDEIKTGLEETGTTWQVMDFFNVNDWKFLHENEDSSSDGNPSEQPKKKLSPEGLVTYQNWKKE